jgi:hypothetical protein
MRCASLLLLALAVPTAAPARTPAPADVELYFISPADGDTIEGPVTVRFGLRNMGIAPAGTDVAGTGHHHLLIDAGLPALDQPIPVDDRHRHFGKGQTETVLELAPGTHTLQLLLGDFAHVPFDPPIVSKKITITVR